MAKGKRPHKHCQGYLSARRRIKNKTREQEGRIKDLKPESQEIIKKNCKIGRKKEIGAK